MRRLLLVVRNPVGRIRTQLKYVYPLLHEQLPDLAISLVVPRTDQAEVIERDLCSLPIKYVYLELRCTPQMMASGVNPELASGSFDLVHSHGFIAGLAVYGDAGICPQSGN
jgi:hypothetical protein